MDGAASARGGSNDGTAPFAHDDLAAICAQVADPRRELFHANQYYGFDLWVKRAAGWPEQRRLRVLHPHGVTFSPLQVAREEIDAHLPIVAAYPAFRRSAYTSAGHTTVMLGASPLLYAARLLGGHRPSRAGTLFFPSHSSAQVSVAADDAANIRDLDALPASLRPITVCIYWADFDRGRHRTYLDAGYRVVSCGHRFRADFTDRLWDLLRGHRTVLSDALGSHLFYAAVAGCRVGWLNAARNAPGTPDGYLGPPRYRPEAFVRLTDVGGGAAPEARQMLGDVFDAFVLDDPGAASVDDQRQIANAYLGGAHLRDRDELAALLTEAERLDRRPPPGRLAPPAVRRVVARVGRRARYVRARLTQRPARDG